MWLPRQCCWLLLSLLLLSGFLLPGSIAGNDNDDDDDDVNNDNNNECRIPTVTLRNGVKMPQLMLGTAHLETEGDDIIVFRPEKTYRSLQLALEAGVRGIDSAYIYRSHQAIGHGLANWFANGQLERQDVFVTTKVFHGPVVGIATAKSHMPNLDTMTPDEVTTVVTDQLEDSFVQIGLGYFDLVLMHWPATMNSRNNDNRARRIAAWKVLEHYYERGWTKAIGVSNFSEIHIQQLMDDGATILPMVNQIEASVYLQYTNIIQYCQSHNIVLQAYSPLGRGINDIATDAVVQEIAKKHKRNPGQIALRFLLQKGFTITSLSTSAERLRTNQDIFFFELDDSDMEKLSALARSDGSWGLPSPYDMS